MSRPGCSPTREPAPVAAKAPGLGQVRPPEQLRLLVLARGLGPVLVRLAARHRAAGRVVDRPVGPQPGLQPGVVRAQAVPARPVAHQPGVGRRGVGRPVVAARLQVGAVARRAIRWSRVIRARSSVNRIWAT